MYRSPTLENMKSLVIVLSDGEDQDTTRRIRNVKNDFFTDVRRLNMFDLL